jgi:hypothetical protein
MKLPDLTHEAEVKTYKKTNTWDIYDSEVDLPEGWEIIDFAPLELGDSFLSAPYGRTILRATPIGAGDVRIRVQKKPRKKVITFTEVGYTNDLHKGMYYMEPNSSDVYKWRTNSFTTTSPVLKMERKDSEI